jgi:methylenetetrahydrofolate dehydrogenase (NADP+)/methenyltetrahydrofolate cyclohydrolase
MSTITADTAEHVERPANVTIGQSEYTPLILRGKEVSAQIRQDCKCEIAELKSRHGILPGLAVVRLGSDPASVNYAQRIQDSFGRVGITVTMVELDETVSRAVFQSELARLNVLPEIAGILVQQPLPPQIDLETIIGSLDPTRDVDGIHPLNVGRQMLGLDCYVPATPAGGMAILDYYKIPIEGKRALVIGRSGVVGKPLSQLLLARNATVTVAHSRTTNLPALVAQAEILAVAVGKPHMIKGDMLWPGSVVLDFGAAMVNDHMTGDVDYEAALERVGAITPVPGGTGPVTNAMLLKNTVRAIRRSLPYSK